MAENEDRIRFITHCGRAVLFVDLSGCAAPEVERLCKLVPAFVTQQPRESVLILGDFTDAKLDRTAVTTLKESLVFDRPHVKKAAWVGAESIPNVFYENIKSFSQRDLPRFSSREEALNWLVNEEEKAQPA
jgi:hypothetical protein